MNNKIVVGIAWFYKDDWQEWKNISIDDLEDTYEEWLIEADLAISKFEKEGYTISKVTITLKDFKNWCKKNNKRLDSPARSQYVAELLEKSKA